MPLTLAGLLMIPAMALAGACRRDAGHSMPAGHPLAAATASAAASARRAKAPAGGRRDLVEAFSGQQAYAYTRAVVDFGPRPPGTAAHRKMEAYILARLRADGAAIELDRFTASTPVGRLPMVNIIAKFPAAAAGRPLLMVAGHYDTKRLPHFVGANDGGSSTGMLLELAQVLAHHRLSDPVWLLFLDGEEALRHWTASDSVYGSRQLAAKFQQEGLAPRIRALILVDMIGDKQLDIPRDTYSTGWVNDFVESAARQLGYSRYFFQTKTATEDDHQPFLHAGIPAVDLIDTTYGPSNRNVFGRWWHTPQDTMDKLSPNSFTIVGRTVLKTLQLLAQQ